MNHNWILISTEKNRESKAAAALIKKGYPCYYPTLPVKNESAFKANNAQRPLFEGMLFVYVADKQLPGILKVKGVKNLVYWKQNPVTVTATEISGIRMITENHTEITTENIPVCAAINASILEESIAGKQNDLPVITHKKMTVTLPSMGYKLSAVKDHTAPSVSPAVTVKKRSFAKMISPLFMFGF